MAKKHKSPQVEIKWSDPEPFALVVQTSTDGDRVTDKAAQSQADKQESEKRQEQFA